MVVKVYRLELNGERRIDVVVAEVVLLEHRVVEATRQAPLFYVLYLHARSQYFPHLRRKEASAG